MSKMHKYGGMTNLTYGFLGGWGRDGQLQVSRVSVSACFPNIRALLIPGSGVSSQIKTWQSKECWKTSRNVPLCAYHWARE